MVRSCGKRRYKSEGQAARASLDFTAVHGSSYKPYRCHKCDGGWHLTTMCVPTIHTVPDVHGSRAWVDGQYHALASGTPLAEVIDMQQTAPAMPAPVPKFRITNRAIDSVRGFPYLALPKRTDDIEALLLHSIELSAEAGKIDDVVDAEYPGSTATQVAEISAGGQILYAVLRPDGGNVRSMVIVLTRNAAALRWSSGRWQRVTRDASISAPVASQSLGDKIAEATMATENLRARIRELFDGSIEQWSSTDAAISLDEKRARVGDAMKAMCDEGYLARVNPGVYRKAVAEVPRSTAKGSSTATLVERITFVRALLKERPHINAMGKDGISEAVKAKFGVSMRSTTIAQIRAQIAIEAGDEALKSRGLYRAAIPQAADGYAPNPSTVSSKAAELASAVEAEHVARKSFADACEAYQTAIGVRDRADVAWKAAKARVEQLIAAMRE